MLWIEGSPEPASTHFQDHSPVRSCSPPPPAALAGPPAVVPTSHILKGGSYWLVDVSLFAKGSVSLR